MIKLYDKETGKLVQELSDDPDDYCQGIKTGEIGAMCGGCDGCLLRQAEHSGGYNIEMPPHVIPGDERCMMYHLHYVGGPHNGEIANSFRPYHKMRLHDGTIYEADDIDNCQEWVDDWTRKIVLNFKPDGVWP